MPRLPVQPGGSDARIFPPPFEPDKKDQESLDVWGFADTRFHINKNGHVQLTGTRYNLSGLTLPDFLPWVEEVMGIEIDVHDVHTPKYPPRIPKPVINGGFLRDIQGFLSEDQIVVDPLIRLRHGHGHTQEEMYAIKYGEITRVPDLVVFPTKEDHVCQLVRLALKHDVCLIPYGGGTCVTQALQCPENERRLIVSIDMKRMSRIVWIDPVNRLARIEAGAVGRHIMTQLAQYGFTIGHEPDSVEFSTLGGWIATHASGMKKNRYGNIEDLVLDFNVVTPQGTLKRTSVVPRESVGLDPHHWIFGSEGSLGVVTSAVVKIFPLPEVQEYGSLIFPDFESGVGFMYELTQTGVLPASIRLVDNLQFQFSLALKAKAAGLKAAKSRFEKWFVTRVKGFDPLKMVACTIVFEGARREVAGQKRWVRRLARKYGGMSAGAENGRRGYEMTFGIAYIRDFVMNHYVLAESFETSVTWSQAMGLCENVKKRVWQEHQKRQLPGKPFITCRLTQVYDTGVCIYFYFAFYYKGVPNPTRVYAQIEEAAREEILKSGGALSHHHGVGKLRKRFLKDIKSPAALLWNQQAKKAVDPQNIFGCRNQLVSDEVN